MRAYPDTIMARAALILTGALLAITVLGYFAYKTAAESLATDARDAGLAERIVSIKRAIASIPSNEERDKAAHALATASLDVHWSRVSLVLGNISPSERARAMEARLKELAPEIAKEAFRVGVPEEGDAPLAAGGSPSHLMVVSIRLEDGSWINFASPIFGTAHHLSGNTLVFAIIIGLGVGVIAVLLLRWITKPLQDLAIAAEGFTLDATYKDVREEGPAEVRRAGRAFNNMASRIRKLVAERTQALAAVSHDLRTPITRLRLRSELLGDELARSMIDQDLTEMESMIDSTLEYLKMGVSHEQPRPLDVATMLATIVDCEIDQGHSIRYSGVRHAPIMGRPLSIKRAFWNIIGNALKFGKNVSIMIHDNGASVIVDISDDGPGIADSEFEKVFEPFYRIEGSRSRNTGGTGLGLTIAKAIIVDHTGNIELQNQPDGGLKVSILLPRYIA